MKKVVFGTYLGVFIFLWLPTYLHHNISLIDSLIFAGGFTAMAIIGTFPLAILALKNK